MVMRHIACVNFTGSNPVQRFMLGWQKGIAAVFQTVVERHCEFESRPKL